MQMFYDGQIKRYLTQFMRLMSNFAVQDSAGNVKQVPVRYGDMSRQVAAIVNKNSENVVPTAPFIACYIKNLKLDRSRIQDPTYVNKLQVRERSFDEAGQGYLNTQGANYTVERVMPTPYEIVFTADIWTSNNDQKFQLWEQITVLFNPSMELQTTDNYIDWTSLSVLELTDSTFETRTVPQATNNDISVAQLQFTAPIWITPPAKVKRMGIITKIISNVFTEPVGTGKKGGYDDAPLGGDIFHHVIPTERVTVTPGDFNVLILNNKAVLVPKDELLNVSDSWVSENQIPHRPSWYTLLDLYPGKFTAGLSQIRLLKPDNTEIVGFMTLSIADESIMNLNIDIDTIPVNTIISDLTNTYSRGTVDAIINPETFNPALNGTIPVDKRYLILEDVYLNSGANATNAWSSLIGPPLLAPANSIIEWTGSYWAVLFDSSKIKDRTYITNAYTGIQYMWDGVKWSKSFEGVYENYRWRLVL